MTSPDFDPQANPPDFIPADAIHLSGPGLAEMTPEHFRMLERLVGDFGLQAARVVNMMEAVSFPEVEVIPVDGELFVDFARRHGFRNDQAKDAWRRVKDLYIDDRRGKYWDYEPYPHIRAQGTLSEDGRSFIAGPVVDLRSVRERLVALPDGECWRSSPRISLRPVIFLRDLVNRRFPDEPPIETEY